LIEEDKLLGYDRFNKIRAASQEQREFAFDRLAAVFDAMQRDVHGNEILWKMSSASAAVFTVTGIKQSFAEA